MTTVVNNLRALGVSFFVLAGISACSKPSDNTTQLKGLTIPVTLSGAEQNVCPMTLSQDANWTFEAASLYLSNPQIKTSNGWQDTQYIDSVWQTTDTALLRFTGQCEQQNNMVLQLNTDVDANDIKGFRALVAVPFEYNHSNPLTLPSPLNDASMLWSWQAGHKFIRIDMHRSDSEKQWWIHLGSVGCESSSDVRPPEEACHYPNHFTINVEKSALPANGMTLDLTALIDGINIDEEPGCDFQSPTLPSCNKLTATMAKSAWAK